MDNIRQKRKRPDVNNSDILENSSKNQANLEFSEISLKNPVPQLNVETPQATRYSR